MARKSVKPLREVADEVRQNQKREKPVNGIGLKWTAEKLLEGALPVLGKAIAGGAVALLVRWLWTE